jgi:hypothetical protein
MVEPVTNMFDALIQSVVRGPYKVRPAKATDIYWITTKTSILYNETAVPYAVKIRWFQKNPNGFWVVEDKNGVAVGSLEILPITVNCLDKICLGQIGEAEKTLEDICAAEDGQTPRVLYIENIMVFDSHNIPMPWPFIKMIQSLDRIIGAINTGKLAKMIYAMPVKMHNTDFGPKVSCSKALLEKLGFSVVAQKTKQGLPLYGCDIAECLVLIPIRKSV